MWNGFTAIIIELVFFEMIIFFLLFAALIAFVVTLVILSLAYFGLGYRIHQIFDQVIPLSVAALTYVTGLSIYLYRRSLKKPSDELSEHGSSGKL